MALATATEYKTSRGISGSGFDTRIAVALAAAELKVREVCGRDRSDGFESGERTEYYDGNGLAFFQLREWPVSSISTVKFRTSSSAFSDTVDSSSYYVNPDSRNRGELYRAGSLVPWDGAQQYVWPRGYANIQVVYTGGYATIPGDLKEAVYVLMDAWWASGLRDNLNTQAEVAGLYNRTMAGADEAAKRLDALLAPWKLGALL